MELAAIILEFTEQVFIYSIVGFIAYVYIKNNKKK